MAWGPCGFCLNSRSHARSRRTFLRVKSMPKQIHGASVQAYKSKSIRTKRYFAVIVDTFLAATAATVAKMNRKHSPYISFRFWQSKLHQKMRSEQEKQKYEIKSKTHALAIHRLSVQQFHRPTLVIYGVESMFIFTFINIQCFSDPTQYFQF